MLGLACEVAIDLATLVAPDGAALVRFSDVSATLLALGYQLGTLVFPTLARPRAVFSGSRQTVSADGHFRQGVAF